MLNQEVDNP